MRKAKLNRILKIANSKKQEGIIIFANEKAYEDLFSELKCGDKYYEKALENIRTMQKETIVKARTCYDEILMAFICIPVKRTLDSEEYLNYIIDLCDKYLIKGPFMYIPSNEIVK